MLQHLRTLVGDERGPTAIEYSLIAMLVAMAIVAAVAFVGNSLSNVFGYMGNQVNR